MRLLKVSLLALLMWPGIILAGSNFETAWRHQNSQSLKLLSMVGIVREGDWTHFTEEEKLILDKAFNKKGELTDFGRRLLQELIGGHLNNPNKNSNGPASPGHSNWPPGRLGSRLGPIVLEDPSLNPAGALQASSRRFDAGSLSGPLVLPGAFNWRNVSASALPAWPFPASKKEESPTVRLLVSPKSAIAASLYNIKGRGNYEALLDQVLPHCSINKQHLIKHQAKLIHMLKVFNLAVIEVPREQAQKLALTLEAEGHFSKPVAQFRLMQAAPSAVPLRPQPRQRPGLSGGGTTQEGRRFASWITGAQTGFSETWTALGKSAAPMASPGTFRPELVDSVPMIRPNKFYQVGIHGEHAVALIVDSGLDAGHSDFGGKTIIAKDFTDDQDNKDYVGHGTHVASTALGTGESSGGRYRGVADGAGKVFVAKIFGKSPFTTEDAILAGLDWGVNEAQGKKIVINMSLGGPGDQQDVLARAVNDLVHQGHGVIVAAGNDGPGEGSIGSPGVARDAITVAATDKEGQITDYSSRGAQEGYKTPAHEEVNYSKPDFTAPGGAVNFSTWQKLRRWIGLGLSAETVREGMPPLEQAPGGDEPCVYESGIIAAKSKDMAASSCDVAIEGKPLYTKMSGTSMATPHVMGANALILDYLERNNAVTTQWFIEAKAAQVEAARSLNKGGKNYSTIEQGAGMIDMDRVYDLVTTRFDMGLPVGNVSALLAYWVAQNAPQAREIRKASSYRVTRFGIVSMESGRVINSDQRLAQLKQEIGRRQEKKGFWEKFKDWFDRNADRWLDWELHQDSREEIRRTRPTPTPGLSPLK